MKNKIYRAIAIFGVFLGLAVSGAQAQTPSKVEVNIPFEFSAAKVTLPAGVYSINRLSGNSLKLRSADGKSTVILNAPLTLTSNDPKAIERLVFSKYGDEYFLSQIWLTVDTGRELFVAKGAKRPERVEISLRTK